jgi:plastocyanin
MEAVIRHTTLALALLAAASILAGCKSHTAVNNGAATGNPPSPASSVAPPVIDPATTGTVEGVVNFKGKPPARIKIDMSADPACAMSADDNNMTEQFVVMDGKLANVFVYVKSGARPSMATAMTPPAILDQKGCRYVPHVIAVQQGGSVEFLNSDPTMHNVHMVSTAGNAVVDVSQGPGAPAQAHQFNTPERMIPVRCNNHPWMQAFVNVADTPYFAVSAADGTFRITGLPAGTYTIAAVHEKLGEQDTQVTVAPQTTANAQFTFAAH